MMEEIIVLLTDFGSAHVQQITQIVGVKGVLISGVEKYHLKQRPAHLS